MREGTLWLIYISKYLELIFLIVMTCLMIHQGVKFIKEIGDYRLSSADETEESDILRKQKNEVKNMKLQCFVLLIVCMVLAVFNVIYNNLFTNLRFRCKVSCKTLGLCIYDAINCLFGFCFLKKVCQDRCMTPFTVVKWVVKGAIFGYTAYIVRQMKLDYIMPKYAAADVKPNIWIDIILSVYVAQHAIFIVFKPILYFVYFILTFCCDKGMEFGENEDFSDRIISYKYIESESELRNNFANHQVGLAELQYNRRMTSIQQRAAARSEELLVQQQQQDLKASAFRRTSTKLANTITY